MSLEIAQREREGILLLDLKGRITMGDEVSAFRVAFEKIANQPGSKLILNMEHVDYVDSTGLGALVMCATRFRNSDGVAKLVNVNRRNIELMIKDRHYIRGFRGRNRRD
jgi:anti-anti-sigma factor